MSCSSHQHTEKPPEYIMPVVSVNGTMIEKDTVAKEMQYHPADNIENAAQKAIHALVIRELLLQNAKDLGIEFTQDNEEEIIGELVNQQVITPDPTAADCERYFIANANQFKSPALIEASHILLAAAPDDSEERINKQQLAEEIISLLEANPKRFADLAKQYSECPSKEMEGNLGQLSKGQTVPEFERQLFLLPEGQVNKAIESRYGFHVVRIDRKVEGQALEYSMCAEKVRDYLRMSVQRKAVSQFIQVLINDAQIDGFEFSDMDQNVA